jgi:hypothetical protein
VRGGALHGGEATEGEQTLSGLTVRRYPQAMLAPEAPGVQAHGGGALLRCGDLGLAYLRRCDSLTTDADGLRKGGHREAWCGVCQAFS